VDNMLRSITREKVLINIARIIVFLGVLLFWEAISEIFGLVHPVWISSPSRIAVRLIKWIMGDLAKHMAVTLWETMLGFAVGVSLGIMVGLILGLCKTISVILDPFIMALNSLPRIVLAPLFILWFGIGIMSKVVLIITMVFFILLYNTLAGVRSIDPMYLNLILSLGGNFRHIMTKIVLPWCVPYIFAGIKLSIGMSLVGAVIGEFLASNVGLGFLIAWSSSMFDTTGVFAGIVILMVLALVIDGGMKLLERRLQRWRPST